MHLFKKYSIQHLINYTEVLYKYDVIFIVHPCIFCADAQSVAGFNDGSNNAYI